MSGKSKYPDESRQADSELPAPVNLEPPIWGPRQVTAKPRRGLPGWAEHTIAAVISAGVTLLILAGTGHCADLRTPLLVYGGAGAADVLSTRYALAHGAREANPLIKTNLEGWKAVQV